MRYSTVNCRRAIVKLEPVMLVLLAFSFLILSTGCIVAVNSNSFILETEQHWDTFGLDGVFEGHNLALADIDEGLFKGNNNRRSGILLVSKRR